MDFAFFSYLQSLGEQNVYFLVLIAGLFVTLTTTLGAFMSVFSKKIPSWGLDFALAFSGGVMIVASFTSLILPAIELSGFFMPALGILTGFLIIYLLDEFLPHETYSQKYEGPEHLKKKVKFIWLLVFAIILHNIPEGLAVGTSIIYNLETGIITAFAIGIQDIPEGLAVSLPLVMLYGRFAVPFFVGFLSGVSEMISALAGAYAFSIFYAFLPYGLGLAGGAMLYVSIKEIFPEIYKDKSPQEERLMTLGIIIGFMVMLFLDSTLG